MTSAASTAASNPLSTSRVVRVFISSTFRDMHSERETLVKTVFPLLRSKLAPYHIDVHEIDMRWGVTEAQANDNQTLSLCLEQVLDSHYFVGLLGDRYGWIPPADRIAAATSSGGIGAQSRLKSSCAR